MCLSVFISASKCVLVFVCLSVRHTTREGILTLNNDSSISPNPFSSLPIYLTIVFSHRILPPSHQPNIFHPPHDQPPSYPLHPILRYMSKSFFSLSPVLPSPIIAWSVGRWGRMGWGRAYVINRRDRMSKLNASLTPPSVQFACSINRLITWSVLPYEWLPYSTLCRSVDVPLPLPLYPSSAAAAAPDAVSRERLHLS